MFTNQEVTIYLWNDVPSFLLEKCVNDAVDQSTN